MGQMRIAMCVAFVALLGCSRSDAPPPSRTTGVPAPGKSSTPSPFREGIDLAESQSALENGQLSDRFDFSRLRQLWVRINLAGMGGVTVVRLTLTTPSGSTFYESNVAYSPDPNQTEMRVPNAPHPITVFPAQPVNGGHALLYAVPVVGTALARYPVPGRWRVDAAIDGGRVISTEIEVSFAQ